MSTPVLKPTLLVLAAGIGSRYGGIKQIEGFGPGGETIMDYSLYDAWKSGFGKVVFVVRREILDTVSSMFIPRIDGKMDVRFAVQELDSLIPARHRSADRKKPWGTGHAVLCAEAEIEEPFVVINADDFYGREAFAAMADFLRTEKSPDTHSMVGYRIENVLSDFGTVARGVGQADSEGYLTSVVERFGVRRQGDEIVCNEGDGIMKLDPSSPVSMNFWGFQRSVFDLARTLFDEFLESSAQDVKAEFFIPIIINEMIRRKKGRIRILGGGTTWFGVTYQEDRPVVMAQIRKLIDSGVYPSRLWS